MQSGSGEAEIESSGAGLLTNLLDFAGLEPHHLVEKIAEVVIKKINTSLVPPAYQNYNLGPPAQVSTENPDTTPSAPFAIAHTKDDLNDKYDEVHLLKTLSPKFRRQGQILLKEFDKRANQITWTGDGTLLIDQTSIPQSNIFVIFPLLFKATKFATKLPGFEDLVLKIHEIGLGHLIKSKLRQGKVSSKKLTVTSEAPSASNAKWWFIG